MNWIIISLLYRMFVSLHPINISPGIKVGHAAHYLSLSIQKWQLQQFESNVIIILAVSYDKRILYTIIIIERATQNDVFVIYLWKLQISHPVFVLWNIMTYALSKKMHLISNVNRKKRLQ